MYIRTRGIAAALTCLLAATSINAAKPGAFALVDGCDLARPGPSSPGDLHTPVFPPPQLEALTPFAPTAFAVGGSNYLIYELHLQNFSQDPLAIRGLEIIDASSAGHRPLVSLDGPQLYEKMIPVGASRVDGEHPLAAGARSVVMVCVAFAGGSALPSKLLHRVRLEDAVADGPVIETRRDEVKALGAPVSGGHWIAENGLSIHRHHRPGLFVAGGTAQISRRYAIDWKRRIDGEFLTGDPLDVRAYHAYGQEVLAVADATVVLAKDGVPDNVPRTAAGFSTAVPITMETVAGNAIVLDLGAGQFAYYAHLKPGSVQVQQGDRVRRGQPLGQIGNSGDARWPHLHFQVTNGPDILASEGMPYVFSRFRIQDSDGQWSVRTGEFPLDSGEIDFSAD